MKRRIGIISAFDDEADQKLRQNLKYKDYGGRRFYYGYYRNKKIVSVVSGIGMTNVALTTQILIDKFKINTVIFIGIGGAINPKYKIGDIVISSRWINYQYQKSISNGPSCYYRDTAPNFPNKFFPNGINPLSFKRLSCNRCEQCIEPFIGVNRGMDIPMYIQVLTKPDDAYKGEVPERFFLDVSKQLLEIAQKAIKCIKLPFPINGYQPSVSIGDTGISADTFVDNVEYVNTLFAEYKNVGVTLEVADMESASLALTAISNKCQYIIIRGISDIPGEVPIPPDIHELSVNNLIVLDAILDNLH